MTIRGERKEEEEEGDYYTAALLRRVRADADAAGGRRRDRVKATFTGRAGRLHLPEAKGERRGRKIG
jgi:hypothetical protein